MSARAAIQGQTMRNGLESRPTGPKVFFVGVATDRSGLVWTKNLWAFKRVLAEVAPMVPLDTVEQVGRGRIARYLSSRRERNRFCDRARPHLDPHGPNVLWIEVFRRKDLVSAANLSPIWSAFSHRIMVVNDALFPDWIRRVRLKPLTRIYAFSAELAKRWGEALGAPGAYLCPSTDVLRHRCDRPYRPIDVLAIGRRDWSIDEQLARRFCFPGRELLFVDPNPRNYSFMPLGDEYAGLMDLYSKSKIAMCFEASHLERYRGLSPLNERWIHAWASGCTVVGRRPRCPQAQQMMDWPESSLELPDDPADSVAFIESLIRDPEGLERRRRRNVIEALRRHDTRHRLSKVFDDLSIEAPLELRRGLQLLADAAGQTQRSEGSSRDLPSASHLPTLRR